MTRQFHWFFVVMFQVLGVTGCGGTAMADSTHARPGASDGRTPGWLTGETGKLRYLVDDDGNTYLGFWVETPLGVHRARPPLAISLVIDTSGSMSGDRIDNARIAALGVLERLKNGDIVSVIGFESRTTEYVEPTVVSPETRAVIASRIRELQATNGTNMYAGLELGEARLRSAPDSHPLRRVVLISDGHANEGPSDASSLGLLAARGTDHGVQVTAIGVGTGYNEEILNALAVRSSGRLYHLEEPAQMAQILEDELGILGETVAMDAWIEITPEPGTVLLGVETLGGEMRGAKAYVKLGTLVGGQRRGVLVRAKVDTRGLGTKSAARAKLVYREANSKASREERVAVTYEIVGDARRAKASASSRVSALQAVVEAARVREAAVATLNEGDYEEASADLRRASSQLSAVAAAAPKGSAERKKLERMRDDLDQAASRAASGGAGRARSEALKNNAASMDALMGN
ncbi:MAG: VWA domain-containing protein [Polyangiales bacterium]|nr:VWA domain-containing protein [Myxococcales bacterium]